MRAELKEIHSPDIELESFWPEDTKNFGFYLEAMIGPEGQEGEESFGFQVCTPAWLETHYSETDVLFCRHMIIVFEYDVSRIKSSLSNYCERCFGETWQDIANALARIGHWEFEDYTPPGK